MVDCTGADATMTNTGSISVWSGHYRGNAALASFAIDLSGGPFVRENRFSFDLDYIDTVRVLGAGAAGGFGVSIHGDGGWGELVLSDGLNGPTTEVDVSSPVDDWDFGPRIFVEGSPYADRIDTRGVPGESAPYSRCLDVDTGGGDDTVFAGRGIQRYAMGCSLRTGAGNDRITATPYDDQLHPGPGNDVVAAGGGTDRLYFDPSWGTASSGRRLDLLDPNAQATGEGLDTVTGVESVTGSPGPDVLRGTDGGNSLAGGAGNDELTGRGGTDAITGGDGDDTIQGTSADGGAGNDTVEGGRKATGGAGNDPVKGDLAEGGAGNDIVEGVNAYGDAGDDTLRGINVFGDDGNDALTVLDAGGDNRISGGPGDDTYAVSDPGGYDVLDFHDAGTGVRVDLSLTGPQDTGAGVETLPPGIDELIGTWSNDVLRGSAATERIVGEYGDDVVAGGGGGDVLDGGGQWRSGDTLDYGAAPGAVDVDLGSTPPRATWSAGTDTLAGFEHVLGSPHADTLAGDALANRLEGGRGADQLSGRDGADVLVPGNGEGGGSDGGDDVDGGPDVDTLLYNTRSSGVTVRLDGLRNDGADPDGDGASSAAEEGDRDTGIKNVSGGSGADRLEGFGNTANLLRGNGGDDWLDGGLGKDRLEGGLGVDTVSYAQRTDRVAIRLDGLANDGADPNGDGFSSPQEEGDLVSSVHNAVGGSGPDILVAGRASRGWRNVLTGGPGADFLDAVDGWGLTDRLVCGTEIDSYRRDPSDATDGCETAVP